MIKTGANLRKRRTNLVKKGRAGGVQDAQSMLWQLILNIKQKKAQLMKEAGSAYRCAMF